MAWVLISTASQDGNDEDVLSDGSMGKALAPSLDQTRDHATIQIIIIIIIQNHPLLQGIMLQPRTILSYKAAFPSVA